MANFFGKPKGGSARASPAQDSDSGAGPSTSQSEFERTFKPFVVKKGAEIAPTNWFSDSKKKSHRRRTFTDRDIIVIDEDESDVKGEIINVDMEDVRVESSTDVGQMTAQGW